MNKMLKYKPRSLLHWNIETRGVEIEAGRISQGFWAERFGVRLFFNFADDGEIIAIERVDKMKAVCFSASPTYALSNIIDACELFDRVLVLHFDEQAWEWEFIRRA